MEPRAIGFGVVGLGMGKHHCKVLARGRGVRLVAVCDTDPERLTPTAEEYKCKAYASYADMLKDPEVEAVCIATPSGMHADMGLEAAAAGRHMMLEKPIDIDLAKVARLIKATRKAKLKAGCIFQLRTDPLNRRIKAAIDQGRLGRLIGVHAVLPSWRAPAYFEGVHGTWRGTWAMDGGGSLMNQGVHTVDLVQWLAGRVARLYGAFGVFAHKIEAEDKTVACLHFANGALGTLTTTTAAWGGDAPFLLIHGEKGTIEKSGYLRLWKLMDDKDGVEEKELMSYYGPRPEASEGAKLAVDPTALSTGGHQYQIEDLADAIRENRDPYITIDSATHAVEIINAVYRSGRTGRPVTIK